MELEWIRLEVWVAGESAACCWVNLALAGFGVGEGVEFFGKL
jgi:hypothetical protein